MKKDIYVYPAIFSYEEDGISVVFPDLPGCFSCGDNDEEALRMAKEALCGYMWSLEDHDDEIPSPTSLNNVHVGENERAILIEAYMPLVREALPTRAVKKTLTIPAWMDEAAKRENINFSQVLQAAILSIIKSARSAR